VRWLWLIGLYSGMRLAEIGGCRREDVHEVDGVLVFNLRVHEGRGLKNKSSRRIVPVHDELLRLGFTKDVLPFRSSTGSVMTPHYLGRVANEWLRKNVTTDSRLTLHSTRHSAKDRLRAARVPEQEQRALMGHSARGVADSYGLGFPVNVLRDAVNAIRY
jgi:integrase